MALCPPESVYLGLGIEDGSVNGIPPPPETHTILPNELNKIKIFTNINRDNKNLF